jgi:hypothetical protein
VEGAVRPRQGAAAGRETRWITSSSTWWQRGLERTGSTGGGCAAGITKQEEQGARAEEDDEGVKSRFRAQRTVKKEERGRSP